ncbi:MAG: hypothetical protein ACFFA4_09310 [Promethearchaeota archaeon]
MDKTFRKTFKLICDSCGEFTHTDTLYCEKCGAKAIREATKEDYEKHEKAATEKTKESRKVADGLKRDDEEVKKKADKVKKDKKKADKEAEKEAERVEKAEKKSMH